MLKPPDFNDPLGKLVLVMVAIWLGAPAFVRAANQLAGPVIVAVVLFVVVRLVLFHTRRW
jgi:succinate dehydrogenase/fumarate reductase cytochrome b subunit